MYEKIYIYWYFYFHNTYIYKYNFTILFRMKNIDIILRTGIILSSIASTMLLIDAIRKNNKSIKDNEALILLRRIDSKLT